MSNYVGVINSVHPDNGRRYISIVRFNNISFLQGIINRLKGSGLSNTDITNVIGPCQSISLNLFYLCSKLKTHKKYLLP